MGKPKVEQALELLQQTWDLLCPDCDIYAADDLIADVIKEGTTDVKEHCRIVVGRLYDGLAYGNWPSAV